ncbi:hypothetical protein HanOQP8_Chr17g0657651 [Helianthus annuus]|nr:hypothetical protein HanHA89_Chr17g0703561 [Helianthus annuus]KAJ0636059.1 hypothetical protein HanOQP8_Chr17g0657651 [Helianthus annuus]
MIKRCVVVILVVVAGLNCAHDCYAGFGFKMISGMNSVKAYLHSPLWYAYTDGWGKYTFPQGHVEHASFDEVYDKMGMIP